METPRQLPVTQLPGRGDKQQQPDSSFTNNAMTRLWKNAEDRETGAEAVEAMRARWRELEDQSAKQNGRKRWFRR